MWEEIAKIVLDIRDSGITTITVEQDAVAVLRNFDALKLFFMVAIPLFQVYLTKFVITSIL